MSHQGKDGELLLQDLVIKYFLEDIKILM